MFVCAVLVLSIVSICAASDPRNGNVSVVTMQVDLGTPLTIFVSNDVEYILEFRPRAEEVGRHRVRVSSDGGDEAHPLLLVLRQNNGARTWQLPYKSGERTLYEIERTLCFTDYTYKNASECGGVETDGLFSLHVSSRCGQQLRVSVLAYTTQQLLRLDTEQTLTATLKSAAVAEYRWSGSQRGVLLEAASHDDVCGAIALQPITACPVEEYTSEVSLFTVRMSILHSGGVHVERKRFPEGFLVVSMVYPEDVTCTGVQPEDEAWLWEDALLPQLKPRPPYTSRTKTFIYTLTEAISPRQYWLASLAVLGVVALFYIVAGALLLLQRWPAWTRLVPRAATQIDGTSHTQPDNGTTPRRNIDTETLDGSDVSDTDSEEGEQRNTNNSSVRANNTTTAAVTSGAVVDATQGGETDGNHQIQTNDGQNGTETLHLTALSRRRLRTLKARADRYPPLLLTVCVFYSLPVLQLLLALQVLVSSSGSLDVCYYNFLCSWRAGELQDLNHVVSNLAYLLLGALLLLHLWRRRALRKRSPPHPDYGIPEHYGLLAALGLGMMAVALMSAAYHICPHRLSFQFDTAFMYVLSVLINVKLYQARHPDINARAHATFAALACLIALAVWGVWSGGALFWSLFSVLHVFTVLLLSLQIYYIGQFKFEKPELPSSARQLLSWRPKYKTRATALAAANFANWGLAIYGLAMAQNNFASHLLNVLLANALLHMLYYILMKLVHKERLKWYSTVITVAAAIVWIPALYFFVKGNSEWSLPPAQSRHYNHRCLVLQFYDAHDLWHLLSAAALYLSICAILTWDDGLAATPRHKIPVF